ncbi:sugar phosphate isomerase/epimerase [Candidatus Woesearchaeota archaeon]|nr:sugar phosphate isomerase/epimerase [Candidatus Woesearchaeota archaeon]
MKFGVSTMLMFSEMLKHKEKPLSYYKNQFLDVFKKTLEIKKKYNLDCFEILSLKPIISNLAYKGEIKKLIRGVNCTYHLPFIEYNLAAFSDKLRTISLKDFKEDIDLCVFLDIKRLVIHTGWFSSAHSLLPKEILRNVRESLRQLVDYSKKYNMEFCAENLPINDTMFHTPEEMELAVECGTYICLDTGHAITNNIDPVKFLDHFGDKIKHIHLVDDLINKPDMHLPIGDGDLDYVNLFKRLKEMNYKGNIIIELGSEAGVEKSLKKLENIK